VKHAQPDSSPMSKRKRRRVNATGRNNSDQYAPLSYPFLRSVAWRSLSGAAVKVWLEIRSRFNGGNNGKLSLSLDEGARLLGLGKATIQRALQELQEKGFLVRTKQGHWYGRQASLWRITDKGCDGNLPTHEWKMWRPQEKQSPGSKVDRNPHL